MGEPQEWYQAGIACGHVALVTGLIHQKALRVEGLLAGFEVPEWHIHSVPLAFDFPVHAGMVPAGGGFKVYFTDLTNTARKN